MDQTRSERLARVAADLEAAKQISQGPNFRLKEMNDLLEGKNITISEPPRKDSIAGKLEIMNNI